MDLLLRLTHSLTHSIHSILLCCNNEAWVVKVTVISVSVSSATPDDSFDLFQRTQKTLQKLNRNIAVVVIAKVDHRKELHPFKEQRFKLSRRVE